MVLCAPWSDTYLHNLTTTYLNHQNQLDKLGNIDLKPVNKLMTTSKITKTAPLPLPSTNLQGKQICMSCLDLDNRKFSNTYDDKFQDQLFMVH